MSLLSTLKVGRTALKIASAGVEVVGRNVANAGTDGYHRKDIQAVPLDPIRADGGFFIGEGVGLAAIRRSGDDLLSMRQTRTRGEVSYNEAAYNRLYSVESLFDEAEGLGMADRMDAFFDSLEAATTDPSDVSLRTSVVDAADALARAVRNAGTTLADSRTLLDGEIQDTLTVVNATLAQVANLQQRILSDADVSGQGELLDQRDLLVNELADSLGVEVRYSADNSLTLLMGGVAVVSGGEAQTLTYTSTSATDYALKVSVDGGTIDVSAYAGGEIGGWLAARGKTAGYETRLNTFADAFATALNGVHATGVDGYGAAGGAMFTFTVGAEAASLAVDTALAADPMLLAAGTTTDAGDSTNLQAMTDLQGSALVGGSTFATYLAGLYTDVGLDIRLFEEDYETTSSALSDLDELQASISGVDLDDEAADLLTWQAAYQAASKVIEATNSLLQDLLSVVR